MRSGDVRIALIDENSQGARNGMIYNSLKKVADQYGFEVDNYDMHTAGDEAQITYIQAGIPATAILNGKTADYMITGCGTSEGAMLVCNSFPGVICGYVGDVLDARILAQVNGGNAIATPLAKGSGWGGDLNLEYTFEKLFCEPSGQGYSREKAVPEQGNKQILDDVRKAAFREDLAEIFKGLDQELVRGAFAGEEFGELFSGKCKDERLAAYIRELIG